MKLQYCYYFQKLQVPKLFPKRPQGPDYYNVILLKCRSQSYVPVQHSSHFDADVSLELSSVHVAAEVFDCGKYNRASTPQYFLIKWKWSLDNFWLN